jgi:hypothetical protein
VKAVRLILALAPLSACSGARPARTATAAVAFQFQCEPGDARLFIDEVDQGTCAFWQARYLGLGLGGHRLRIERENYLPFEMDLPRIRGPQRAPIVTRLRIEPE